MRHIALFVALLVVVGCKKENEKEKAEAPPPAAKDPASGTTTPAPAPAPPTPAPPTPSPTTPAPTPVKLTADELKPTCAKIMTAELAAKTHGATEVTETGGQGKPLVVCQLNKNGEMLGSVTVACNPDLDPTAIERERAAMTKAKELSPPIGRGGYRISTSFVFIDDETPCRLMVNWMTTPADDVWPESLRAIVAAVNPTTLK